MRGISNLLALLIVISIVIGAGITISMFLSGFIQKQVPRGGALILSKIDLSGEIVGDKIVFWFDGQGVHQGTDAIEIKNVTVLYEAFAPYILPGDVEVKLSLLGDSNVVKPNEYVHIIGKGTGPAPKAKPTFFLKITYCYAGTDICYQIKKMFKYDDVVK